MQRLGEGYLDSYNIVISPTSVIPPPPAEWPVVKSIHLFDNVKVKAEWFDITKVMSRNIVNIDTSVLVGGKLDYTIKYTQGLPFGETVYIAFDNTNVATVSLSKGETKSGSVDLTDLIGQEAKITIRVESSPGVWSEVSCDIWITFGFSSEPAMDPTAPQPDWMKYLIWGVAGVVALVVLTSGRQKIVVVKG